MSNVLYYLALMLLAATTACSSRYGKPAAKPPTNLYASNESATDSGRVAVDGLVEFGRSFPLRHRPQGTGTLSISPETIAWSNASDDARSFSIRPSAVKSVTLQCVVRAGGNVCLEIALNTVTGLTYHFRDVEWAGGYNQRIRLVHDHLARNFPRMLFAETIVDSIE